MQRFKSNRHTRERELLRGGEPSQTLFLVPQHYLSLLFISHHYVTVYYSRSCKTCFAMKDQVGQVGSVLYFPISQGRDYRYFLFTVLFQALFLAPFLKQGIEIHDLDFRLKLLFFLSRTSPVKRIWVWWRLISECVGGCPRVGKRHASASIAST